MTELEVGDRIQFKSKEEIKDYIDKRNHSRTGTIVQKFHGPNTAFIQLDIHPPGIVVTAMLESLIKT